MSKIERPSDRDKTTEANDDKLPVITKCSLLRSTQHLGTYDTVKIWSPNVRADQIKNPGKYRYTGVLDDVVNGEPEKIQRILYLDQTYRECEPGTHLSTVGITYSFRDNYTVVTCPSAPALTYGDPMKVLSPDDIPRFQNTLQNVVSEYLDADLRTFDVTRLDSSTVYDMSEDVHTYIDMFNVMTRNSQMRMRKKSYDGETVQFFNKSQSFGFYDKTAKEEFRHDLVSDGRNRLRCEMQMKQRRSLRRYIGRLTFGELANDRTVQSAVKVRSERFYRLFPFDSAKAKEYQIALDMYKAIKQEKGRNVVELLALSELIRRGIWTPDDITAMMRAAGDHRTTIYRKQQKMNDLMSMRADVSDLYDELKTKIDEDVRLVS